MLAVLADRVGGLDVERYLFRPSVGFFTSLQAASFVGPIAVLQIASSAALDPCFAGKGVPSFAVLVDLREAFVRGGAFGQPKFFVVDVQVGFGGEVVVGVDDRDRLRRRRRRSAAGRRCADPGVAGQRRLRWGFGGHDRAGFWSSPAGGCEHVPLPSSAPAPAPGSRHVRGRAPRIRGAPCSRRRAAARRCPPRRLMAAEQRTADHHSRKAKHGGGANACLHRLWDSLRDVGGSERQLERSVGDAGGRSAGHETVTRRSRLLYALTAWASARWRQGARQPVEARSAARHTGSP